MRKNALLCLASCLLLASSGCAGFSLGPLDDLFTTSGLDEATVAAGLRDALETGTVRATDDLSKPGGFFDDPRFRLTLPSEFDRYRIALRAVGLGGQVDDFERTMNSAAETAAGEAVGVFVTAISSMSIRDAFEILQGPDDAATRYFEKATSQELRSRFEPVIESSMKTVGLYSKYADLKRTYDAIPFTKPVVTDLESWITDKTLSALFSTLAAEEARIREDPVARTSALMQKVFGSPEATGMTAAPEPAAP